MIGNKIINNIIKVSRTSLQNSLETAANEAENIGFDREILKRKIYIPRKKTANYWWAEINIIIKYINGMSKNNKSVC